jgi:hypothetical protein
MKKYALLIVENAAQEHLEEGCKPLAAILAAANTTLDSSEFQGIGGLLFDLKTNLIPFCKVTTSAYNSGHQVRVLFLDDTDSFLLQKGFCPETDLVKESKDSASALLMGLIDDENKHQD